MESRTREVKEILSTDFFECFYFVMLESPPFALSPVEGYLWFDRLTTTGVKTPAIMKHDKVKGIL